MKCNSCGALNPAGKKFCGDCGAPLSPAATPASPNKPLIPDVYFWGRKAPPFAVAGIIICACLCASLYLFGTASRPSATSTPESIRVVSLSTATPQASPQSNTQTTTTPTETAVPKPSGTPTPAPQVKATTTVNVRQGPGTGFAIVGKLSPGTSAIISGISDDRQWLQIEIPGSSTPGWVSKSVVAVAGSTETVQTAVSPPEPTATVVLPTRTRLVPTATHIPPTARAAMSSDGVPSNPWGYNFTCCNRIDLPPANFCSYFSCINNFWNGKGYVIQCRDGMFSLSGGRTGSCSWHGGNNRPLYTP